MKRKRLMRGHNRVVFALCYGVIIFLVWSSGARSQTAENGGLTRLVCFDGQCLNVETARTPQERTRGLQKRTKLDEQNGMLFVFNSDGRHSFWMKDTWIALDIIWLDRNLRVVHIVPSVPPCKADPCSVYKPDRDSFYVLEANAGTAARLGLEVGNQAEWR